MRLREFLKLSNPSEKIDFEVLDEVIFEKFKQQLIRYQSQEGDWIPAYLLIPASGGPHPAVVIHHQHNGERHLGKSEVVGIAGDPLQAFGHQLASIGYVVLAPDSICFEDRRRNKIGITPDTEEADWLQHFNEMSYRLINGDSLMRKILDDASLAVSLLASMPIVSQMRIGVLGHSYGGNTALFQGATDDRIQFICSSGALCSYQQKMKFDTGLEMALVIPNIAAHFELDRILSEIAPRDLLIISSEQDKYSKDADQICKLVENKFKRPDSSSKLIHFRDSGGHEMTKQKYQAIIDWMKKQFAVSF